MSRGSGWKGSVDSIINTCGHGGELGWGAHDWSHALERGILIPPGEGGQEAWIRAERRAQDGNQACKGDDGGFGVENPGEPDPGGQLTGGRGAGGRESQRDVWLPGLADPSSASCWPAKP